MKQVMLMMAFLFVSAGLTAQDEDKKGAYMEFDESVVNDKGQVVYNYGEIAHKGDGTSTFRFKNTGTEPLVLSKVRSSCGCTVPAWPRKPIMPGEEETIEVEYDTRRMGKIYKSISIYSNAKNSPIIARIKGEVVKKEDLTPKKETSLGAPSAGDK
ncbi:MAG: DUF1573 domain-containing protein [Bacteroidota bacterium]